MTMVTSEWRKRWYQLDTWMMTGDMLTMSWWTMRAMWNERGKRLVNSWIKEKVPSTTASMIPVKTVITGILTAKAAS